MSNNKENKMTIILKNFIDELSRGYQMTVEEKEVLEKLANEDATKLYHLKEKK